MHHGRTGADPLEAMVGTEHDRKLRAKKWAQAVLADAVTATPEVWAHAGKYGLFSLLVDEEHGGAGASSIDALLTLEGLGAADVDQGLVFALASQMVTISRAVGRFGSSEQHERWLGPLMAGTAVGAFAMSEPQVGSDLSGLQTLAVEQPDGSYVIDGTKSWITLAPVCDVALVFTSTDPSVGRWGITAFLVDMTIAGVTKGPPVAKAGLAGCPWGELHFENVEVGPAAVLGRVGAGASIFSAIVEAERFLLYGASLGTSERLIAQCVDRARQRHQGGKHIGAHQAVAHRIVDMQLRHDASRLLLYRAAAVSDRGASLALPAALAKIAATDLAPGIALDAMRTYGAAGFVEAAGIATALADSIGGLSFSATADIARNIAASELGLDRAAQVRE